MQVVSVFDRGYLEVERDFPDQKSSLPNRKMRNQKELTQGGKKVQPEPL